MYDFQGIVLAYWKIRLADSNGQILNSDPSVCIVDATASFLVFCFAEGSLVEGTVTDVAEDYVSLLLLGETHVTIVSENMGGEFQYDPDSMQWVHAQDDKQAIAVGTTLAFKVQE